MFSSPPPPSAALTVNTPETAPAIPTRLDFSESLTSPFVPKQGDVVEDFENARGGDTFVKPKKIHRRSLDGSFRIITSSGPSTRHCRNDSTRTNSVSNLVCNSTPLSTKEDVFDLGSSIASPILRTSKNSTPFHSQPSQHSQQQQHSRLTSNLNNHSQASHLASELVINHSYVPQYRHPPPNPLGIQPRRPINWRSRDISIASVFYSNSLTSLFHRVVDTMSPRKKRPSRTTKSDRNTFSKSNGLNKSNGHVPTMTSISDDSSSSTSTPA